MRENYFLDDGAYLCTKIIIKMAQLKQQGKELEDLTASLKEPVESKEIRFKIKEKDFREYGEKVIADLEKYAEAQEGWKIADDNREGIRVYFDKDNGDGWFLLRLSVHDPILPLNIECEEKGAAAPVLEEIDNFLSGFEMLDLSGFNKVKND